VPFQGSRLFAGGGFVKPVPFRPRLLAVGGITGANPFDFPILIAPQTSVVFVCIVTNLGGAAPTITTITGLGGTFSEVANIPFANLNRRISLWVGTGCSGTGSLTVTESAAPGVQTMLAFEMTAINTTTPVVAASAKTATAVANSVSVPPNALASTRNVFVACVNHNAAGDDIPLQGAEFIDSNLLGGNGAEICYVPAWTSGLVGASWTTAGLTGIVVGFEAAAA
jgi:hypothetical protein